MNSDPGPLRALACGAVLALAAGLASPSRTTAQDSAGQRASQAGAALGVDLYRSFAAKEGNVLFSPYSISEALALLVVGADGKTKQELLQALHWGPSSNELAEAFGAQDRHLKLAIEGGETLSVANALWFQQGDAPQAAFLKTAQGDFGVEVRGADFLNNAEATRLEINRWAELKAGGKIHDLTPPGALNENSRLALANAVYFKGQWEHPFEAQGTAPRPFFVAPDRIIMAPSMTETEKLKVASCSDCDLLALPYVGGRLSMVILLPKVPDGLSALEKRLSPSSLFEWLASLDFSHRRNMHVTLPRFKMTYAVDLTTVLRESGVTAAFVPHEADFSSLNGRRNLYVSTVPHAAAVEVNEEGTEAAAATFGGAVGLGGEISHEFRVDHPFIFLIRDDLTGGLVFLGRIVDPPTR
jgi:serpin B